MTMFVQVLVATFASVWAVFSVLIVTVQLTVIIKETSAWRKAFFGTPAKFFSTTMVVIATTLLGPIYIGYLIGDAVFQNEK